ncbi:dirigent protein 22-like [Dorcoceras hygrometricum]|uniref:Dirigent protein n=1 Tax=Dorcoceras hygrometricum TaxID=472368 RepID=A0A2Z7B2P4_9LAMI|nr:dirigent protein 22-like [Dorcoceras hygrometricum]
MMGKPDMSKSFLIYSLIFVAAISGAFAKTGASKDPEPVDKWFAGLKKSLVPKFKFIEIYIQDIRGAANQTVWLVAQSNISATSPTFFGQVYLADNILTTTPKFESTRLGRAQGFGAFSDLEVPALFYSWILAFTSGEYKGSTLSISGRNQVLDYSSEFSIVGGTGHFRMASGIAIGANFLPRDARGIAVLKYTLYFTYY